MPDTLAYAGTCLRQLAYICWKLSFVRSWYVKLISVGLLLSPGSGLALPAYGIWRCNCSSIARKIFQVLQVFRLYYLIWCGYTNMTLMYRGLHEASAVSLKFITPRKTYCISKNIDDCWFWHNLCSRYWEVLPITLKNMFLQSSKAIVSKSLLGMAVWECYTQVGYFWMASVHVVCYLLIDQPHS